VKLNQKEKKLLLSLSRQTLEGYFCVEEKLKVDEKSLSNKLLEKRATFVTLFKNGELRGCIGNILPKFPLFKDVINNSLSAAFSDPRFPQLAQEELGKIKIEISILTIPKRIIYNDCNDLLKKIKPEIHGIILQSGFFQATFLPDVWTQLPKKEDFLTNLSLKAGLAPNAWKNPEAEFFFYTTESFNE